MDPGITRRLALSALAGVVSAGVVAATLAAPSAATATPSDPETATVEAGPELFAAMDRDLGLSAEEAADRFAADAAATDTVVELTASLAETFGGAWIDGDELVVGITDTDQADEVSAAGATPELVAHSESDLAGVVAGLDAAAAPPATEVYGWHVDVATNSVVVAAAPQGLATATELVEASGVDEAAVRVEASTQAPTTYEDVIGGHPYFPGSSRCSVGFSVQEGFVTAGHCGVAGTTTLGYNMTSQGTVAGSVFPGSDRAYVAVFSNWDPQPYVWAYSGNSVFLVQGSQPAAIGAATCRSGSTTGWHCGTITALNQTVNYPQGTVTGLTRTNVCAEPGDSGGSFVAANGQAQGVTSGGSGNCTTGGVTFFQPLNPILNAWGLTLVTG